QRIFNEEHRKPQIKGESIKAHYQRALDEALSYDPDMEDDTKESIDLNYKAKNPSTKAEIQKAFQELFNTTFESDNVTIHETASDLDPNQLSRRSPEVVAWVSNGNIHIIADRVEKGEGVSLLLHEKGVHELLRNSPEYQRVLNNIERILSNPENPDYAKVKSARDRALEAQSRTKNPEAFDVEEETVAYLIQENSTDVTFVKKLIALINKALQRILGNPDANLNVKAMTTLVVSMVRDQGLQVEVQENIETTKADRNAQIEADLINSFYDESESIGPPKDSEESIDNTSKASKNPDYISEVLTDGKSLGWMNRFDFIRQTEKALKPAKFLYEAGEKVGLKGLKMLQNIHTKARAKANKYIEDHQELKDSTIKLVKEKPEEARELKHLMNKATITGEDPIKELSRLSKEANDIYYKTKEMYKLQGSLEIEALEKSVDTLSPSSTNKGEYQKFVATLKNNMKNGIYFPLQRWGSYRVEASTPDGQRYVAFYDSVQELERASKTLKDQGYTIHKQGAMSKAEAQREAPEASMEKTDFLLASKMLEEMGIQEGDPAQKALWQVFMQLKSKPKGKLKERMSRRKGVAGASVDLLRGTEYSINNTFRDITKRYYAPDRRKVLTEAQADLDNIKDLKKQNEANNILDEVKRREAITNDRAQWSKSASEVNFMMYLGANISSALVNLTQTVIVGVPVLSAKFNNPLVVAKELSRGLSDYIRHPMDPSKSFEGAEKLAFNEFKRLGTIDLTEANMHMQLSDGSSGTKKNIWQKALHLSAIPFSEAEKANRVATSIAAYRLAINSGMDHKSAVEYAHEATIEIHFDYSEEGKSRLQRTNVGGVLLAFKS
ncbi:MAG: hypothetical protein DRI46_14570, partial [Chloroflexi bacterium]